MDTPDNETKPAADNTNGALLRKRAAQLFWQGYTVAEISKQLGKSYSTIDSWKRRDGWREAPVHERVGSTLDRRLCLLVDKEEKTPGDYKEIEALGKQLERMARVEKFQNGGNEADLNPKVKNRNKKRKGRKHKNALTDEEEAALVAEWEKALFNYQKLWNAHRDQRIRDILKSRQVGATWYFAREAFMDALETGDNQIFLSASRNQAEVFRSYIIEFVRDVTGKELKGNPLVLENGATLYFLSTNSRTAQSYHGHLYVDEYFWIPRYKDLNKVASGMAAHKKWRKTYISTPSTLGHEAYGFWSGRDFNKGRADEDKVEIDISHDALKHGMLCADGQWRQMLTIEDAEVAGCDLFDIDALKLEYAPDDFANLFMCVFIDDAHSVFKLATLQNCMVDAWYAWDDFRPVRKRPFGNKEVWIGYDPSRTRDDASCVVIAPPGLDGGKFRALEKLRFNNMNFEHQAKEIKKLTERYNVTHIGIDASGMGVGLYELVKGFYPRALKITYSVEVKNRLVAKAKQVIENGRFEFDAGWTDMANAFMTIHRSVTASGKQISYQASRTETTGHADQAWAVMHALAQGDIVSLDSAGRPKKSTVEIF
ncbi:terminase-like family protein [Rhodobiaceae bacterium]|nr:terminase-like family protein [Rhodobiaceae bacterium]